MMTRGFALLAWTALAVGALAVVPLAKKLALNAGASAPAVAFFSVALSAVLVVGGLVVRGRAGRLWTMGSRPRAAVLAVGALGSGLVPLLGLLAMTETTASNRALFQSAYPAATAAAAWLLLDERPARITLGLIGGVCIGLALMNLDSSSGAPSFGWPFWLLLATLPMIGLADVIAKRSLDNQPPPIVAAGRAIGGALVLVLAFPWFHGHLLEALRLAAVFIVIAGVGMAVFAVALYQVFDRTRASIAASLIALAPVLTLAGEAWFLEISLAPLQWLGFAVVIGAVVALARRA